MPQVDVATFFDIVSWTASLYVGGFYALNVAYRGELPRFLETLKTGAKRLEYVYISAAVTRRQLSVVQLFPWISL